jgi:hypothetical protein
MSDPAFRAECRYKSPCATCQTKPAQYGQQLPTSAMPLISDLRDYLFRLYSSFVATKEPVSTPAVPLGEPPRCRFRLDNSTSDVLILPDGRKLGYAQYGSPTGRAILYQHGHPGSRIEGAAFDELGLKLGARIIATDRPGMGWSSPHPSATLLDHPKDLEYLANHLKLEEYSVLVSVATCHS